MKTKIIAKYLHITNINIISFNDWELKNFNDILKSYPRERSDFYMRKY
jgi:hypothetical protein